MLSRYQGPGILEHCTSLSTVMELPFPQDENFDDNKE